MKPKYSRFFAASLFITLSTSHLIAADKFWNPTPLDNTWDTDALNWATAAGGLPTTPWVASDNAFFAQPGDYTVTLAGAQTAVVSTFSGAGTVTLASDTTTPGDLSSTNLTVSAGATLISLPDRVFKLGDTALMINGTLDLTAPANVTASHFVQLFGSGKIIGVVRHSGTGNFSGQLQDFTNPTTSALVRAGIAWNGGLPGTLTLSGDNNSMSGPVLIAVNGSVLKLTSANAIGKLAVLRLEGATNSVLVELAVGDLTRAWATGSNTGSGGGGGLSWVGSNGGFYATGGDRNLTLTSDTDGTMPADVTWGPTTTGNGINPGVAVLGAPAATHKITWTNNINLNGARTFNVGNGAAVVDAQLSGILSGTGASGITKTGAGTLEITGENTYEGATTVNAGILKVTGTSIPDAARLNINAGAAAKVQIPAGGNEIVDTLFINGVPQAAGTYGSTTSAATNKSDTFFDVAGSGIITVTTAGANTFAQWLASYLVTGFLTDTDRDGISNGIEHILGTNPNVASSGLTQISATASSVTFQHSLSQEVASDVSYSYEWSSDLTEWNASGVANTAGTIGTIVASAPVAGVVTVVTTRSGTASDKIFTRIKANNP